MCCSTLMRNDYHYYISTSDIDTNNVDGSLENHPESLLCPTKEEVNSVIDVLDVNAFEIRDNNFSIRGVYPLTAMMNSVCSPNTQNCIGKKIKIFLDTELI